MADSSNAALEAYDARYEDLTQDLARLRCATSRTFKVCVACPSGADVRAYGTLAVAWYDSPQFGRYGLCRLHDEEWARPTKEGETSG